MKRLALRIIPLICLLCLLASCGIKPWSQWSPHEKAHFFNQFYLKNKKDYDAKTANPDLLTEQQKEILRTKKAILTKYYPYLTEYNKMVAAGETPTFITEQTMLDIINEFESLTTEAK